MPHDNTFIGWLTTGMYVATATLCLFAYITPPVKHDQPHRCRAESRFWLILGIALIVLAVNKQLDLQSTLIELVGEISRRDGWHGQRRWMQVAFVLATFIAAVMVMWFTLRQLRHTLWVHRLIIAGVALLLIHLAFRTADIQRIGELLDLSLRLWLVMFTIEWLSLVLIALGGWLAAQRPLP